MRSDDTYTRVEIERRNRIHVLLFAYAYEIKNVSLVSDERFDALCAQIDTSIDTGKYDEWFRENFDPCTGLWVHAFPDRKGLDALYQRVKSYYTTKS